MLCSQAQPLAYCEVGSYCGDEGDWRADRQEVCLRLNNRVENSHQPGQVTFGERLFLGGGAARVKYMAASAAERIVLHLERADFVVNEEDAACWPRGARTELRKLAVRILARPGWPGIDTERPFAAGPMIRGGMRRNADVGGMRQLRQKRSSARPRAAPEAAAKRRRHLRFDGQLTVQVLDAIDR
jgi:hypothetical protein